MNPDFLLIGEGDERSGEMLAHIYRNTIANDPPVARLNFVNAELAKISVNTFITTKIAFANMLARICEQVPDADVDEVTSALGLDTRISPRYLRGAISYGGPCFPRDNVALAAFARSVGAPAFVAEATDQANRDGITRLTNLVLSELPPAGTAAILGLSYKPNTDVVEESPGLYLASALAAHGVDVVAYDPASMPNARRAVGDSIAFADSADEAIQAADVVVIATPWQEFASIPRSVWAREPRRVVIDCWRLLPADLDARGTRYVALGAAPPPEPSGELLQR
jgi:UDPglucose 6-dehydrogenase